MCLCVFICSVSKGKNLSRMLREIWIVCHHLATTTIAVHLIAVFRFALVLLLWSFQIFSLPYFPSFFSLHVQIVQGDSHPEWAAYIDRTNGSTHGWVLANDRWFSIPCGPCDVCSTTLFPSMYALLLLLVFFLFFIRLCCLSVWFMRIWFFFTGALCSHPHATCRAKKLPAQNGRHSRFFSQPIYIFGYSFSAHKFSQRSSFFPSYQW